MPKRRRLFTPNKHKIKSVPKSDTKSDNDARVKEVTSARGRFKGALMDALDPANQYDDSDHESEDPKRDRQQSTEDNEFFTDEEVKKAILKSPPRQSYVLKLFDRSVDLSQFRDDSPLYPICRAWMANQPKAIYRETKSRSSHKEPEPQPASVELPGPEGEPVAKIPDLLQEQVAADKNNINLDYGKLETALPSGEQLLRMHMPRWAAVKQAWQDQIVLKEARYEKTQLVLNKINLEYSTR